MKQILVNGAIHNIEIEYETLRYGTEMIAYREYLPDGILGKMQHITPKMNLLEKEMEVTDEQ